MHRSPPGTFRTETGDEVDLVLERDDGQVIAVERILIFD